MGDWVVLFNLYNNTDYSITPHKHLVIWCPKKRKSVVLTSYCRSQNLPKHMCINQPYVCNEQRKWRCY